ncbi:C40 family peptidase [Aureimonas sp. AU40]|uniref:C40 family peptidase n=1 Tax=Aureimonas sp. AU40 TaxID=1637747 RepID=UPI0007858163|nr:C40 family peptidase [Aureimonas sp. AU40]
MLGSEITKAAQAHAIAEFPRESVGFVVAGRYVPLENVHESPTEHFRIDPAEEARAAVSGTVEWVIHSHPNGPNSPSQADMVAQRSWGIPWAIIVTDGESASDPIMWGDQLPMAPLLGREFVHGLHDCYALIRDTYRVGREGMAAQGLSENWPFPAIELPEVPRGDGWWSEGQDLYVDHFRKFGFREISIREAQPGDVFLGTVSHPSAPTDKINHGGLLVEDDLIFHHLPKRLSRREPSSIWARSAKLWIRYEGDGSDA